MKTDLWKRLLSSRWTKLALGGAMAAKLLLMIVVAVGVTGHAHAQPVPGDLKAVRCPVPAVQIEGAGLDPAGSASEAGLHRLAAGASAGASEG
jgi:hypothetical protein